jgi:uncharacterized protein (TIGR02588 family)
MSSVEKSNSKLDRDSQKKSENRFEHKPERKSERKPEKTPEQESKLSELSGKSPAEYISFLFACGILLSVLGTVGFLWVRDRNQQPPILEITSTVETRQGKYYVPFTVVNSGGETAETVQVVAELSINGEVVESGEQHIDFLSSEEEAEGAFIFTRAPDSGELSVRTASYKLP